MAYTYKIVNGVKIVLTSGDQTKLTAKDAAHWQPGPPPPAMMRSAATTGDKLARMAKSFGLTVEQLKAELAK